MSDLSKYIKKSDIKCPICQTLLDVTIMSDKVFGCPKCRNMGNIGLWQELIKTKEELHDQKTINDAIVEEGQKIIKDYIEKFETTKKQLEIAVDALSHTDWFFDGDYNVYTKDMHNEIKQALKQITALEQKEHFADTSKKIEQKDVK